MKMVIQRFTSSLLVVFLLLTNNSYASSSVSSTSTNTYESLTKEKKELNRAIGETNKLYICNLMIPIFVTLFCALGIGIAWIAYVGDCSSEGCHNSDYPVMKKAEDACEGKSCVYRNKNGICQSYRYYDYDCDKCFKDEESEEYRSPTTSYDAECKEDYVLASYVVAGFTVASWLGTGLWGLRIPILIAYYERQISRINEQLKNLEVSAAEIL